MRHLDLFSGIGGFALAASWVWGDEHEIVGFCEIDSFCQKVLKKHWPDAPIYSDIKELKGDQFNAVELITGGFPCQPFSKAGKQKGKEDDRYLWPEMFRLIYAIRPNWVIGENVTYIRNMALETILFQLESIGYKSAVFDIPAIGVGAPHRRQRTWIVSKSYHPNSNGNGSHRAESYKARQSSKIEFSNQQGGKFRSMVQTSVWNKIDPRVFRVANGVPNRVDRLKSLGNAIVPQVAAVIMQGIKLTDQAQDARPDPGTD